MTILKNLEEDLSKKEGEHTDSVSLNTTILNKVVSKLIDLLKSPESTHHFLTVQFAEVGGKICSKKAILIKNSKIKSKIRIVFLNDLEKDSTLVEILVLPDDGSYHSDRTINVRSGSVIDRGEVELFKELDKIMDNFKSINSIERKINELNDANGKLNRILELFETDGSL